MEIHLITTYKFYLKVLFYFLRKAWIEKCKQNNT